MSNRSNRRNHAFFTVGEIIEELSKYDPKLPFLAGDNDNWYYNVRKLKTAIVIEGKEITQDLIDDGLAKESDGELCVVTLP